jgi:membrane protein
MFWTVLKRAAREFNQDNIQRYAAALAYYTVFSLAPLLLIAISVAGLAFGRQAAEGRIVQEISDLVGVTSAHAVQAMIQNAWRPGAGLLAVLVGIATLFAGASGALNEMKAALDRIWKTVPKKQNWLYWTVSQLVSFAFLLGIGFLLLVSLILSALISAMGAFFSSHLPVPEWALHVTNDLMSFVLISLLFSGIFKWLPDAIIRWRDVWVGGMLTSALFTVGKFGLGLYLGRSGITSAFGAAASLAIILIWIYYSSLIMYFGAEFTRAWAEEHGEQVVTREWGGGQASEGMPA